MYKRQDFFFKIANGVTGKCSYALGSLKTGRVEATLPDWSDRNSGAMEQDGEMCIRDSSYTGYNEKHHLVMHPRWGDAHGAFF